MLDVNKIQVTDADRSVDVPKLLNEMVDAMLCLEQMGATIPREALEMLAVLRRCVVAEREIARMHAPSTD